MRRGANGRENGCPIASCKDRVGRLLRGEKAKALKNESGLGRSHGRTPRRLGSSGGGSWRNRDTKLREVLARGGSSPKGGLFDQGKVGNPPCNRMRRSRNQSEVGRRRSRKGEHIICRKGGWHRRSRQRINWERSRPLLLRHSRKGTERKKKKKKKNFFALIKRETNTSWQEGEQIS